MMRRLADPAVDCQNLRLYDSDTDVIGVSIPARIRGGVATSIGTVLDQIRAKAPKAKVVLMGYPQLIDNAGCLTGSNVPGLTVNVSSGEATWLNSMADLLATTMQGVAAAHGATFADPRNDFVGAGVCALYGEAIHGIVVGPTPGEIPQAPWPFERWGPSAQSFHPKKNGTTLYAQSLTRALRAIGQ